MFSFCRLKTKQQQQIGSRSPFTCSGGLVNEAEAFSEDATSVSLGGASSSPRTRRPLLLAATDCSPLPSGKHCPHAFGPLSCRQLRRDLGRGSRPLPAEEDLSVWRIRRGSLLGWRKTVLGRISRIRRRTRPRETDRASAVAGDVGPGVVPELQREEKPTGGWHGRGVRLSLRGDQR